MAVSSLETSDFIAANVNSYVECVLNSSPSRNAKASDSILTLQ